jgi:hypothetical protein
MRSPLSHWLKAQLSATALSVFQIVTANLLSNLRQIHRPLIRAEPPEQEHPVYRQLLGRKRVGTDSKGRFVSAFLRRVGGFALITAVESKDSPNARQTDRGWARRLRVRPFGLVIRNLEEEGCSLS